MYTYDKTVLLGQCSYKISSGCQLNRYDYFINGKTYIWNSSIPYCVKYGDQFHITCKDMLNEHSYIFPHIIKMTHIKTEEFLVFKERP